VIVNLSDNFFTVEIQRTVVGSAATAIGVGGTATLFDISLTGLDGGEAISAVSYNDALTVGFTGGLAPTKTINFTPTSIELGFGGVRWGNIYHFDINPAPVPIPAAAWLFGSGLLGLIGIARRKAA
jgi:hypothetical protein